LRPLPHVAFLLFRPLFDNHRNLPKHPPRIPSVIRYPKLVRFCSITGSFLAFFRAGPFPVFFFSAHRVLYAFHISHTPPPFRRHSHGRFSHGTNIEIPLNYMLPHFFQDSPHPFPSSRLHENPLGGSLLSMASLTPPPFKSETVGPRVEGGYHPSWFGPFFSLPTCGESGFYLSLHLPIFDYPITRET